MFSSFHFPQTSMNVSKTETTVHRTLNARIRLADSNARARSASTATETAACVSQTKIKEA